jgi:enoyl-CoA hydratase
MPVVSNYSSELTCLVIDRVAILTLNAPERRNALTPELIASLIQAFDDVERDPGVGAVVVTGASPAFCSGAALGDLAAPEAVAGERKRRLLGIYEGFLRVARSPLATVAAVNGPAVGAGMNLALACDVRIAGASGRFDTKFLGLGLHPGGGHTWMARRSMGRQATAATLLFGEKLDAEAALRCGLVWDVVDDDELMHRAMDLARAAASLDPELVRRTKETMAATDTAATLAAAVDIEVAAQVWSMEQPAFRNGPVPQASR